MVDIFNFTFHIFFHFRLEGQVLSQMLRKSIETRDWLNNVEPRSVRAVMKRVVEETTSIGKNHSEKLVCFKKPCIIEKHFW